MKLRPKMPSRMGAQVEPGPVCRTRLSPMAKPSRSTPAELLREKTYEEILVQDILDRAGIGRTTFYAHYFDKQDVLDSMIEQILTMFTHQITRSTADQRVVPSLELFEHIYQSQDQRFRALMRSRAG